MLSCSNLVFRTFCCNTSHQLLATYLTWHHPSSYRFGIARPNFTLSAYVVFRKKHIALNRSIQPVASSNDFSHHILIRGLRNESNSMAAFLLTNNNVLLYHQTIEGHHLLSVPRLILGALLYALRYGKKHLPHSRNRLLIYFASFSLLMPLLNNRSKDQLVQQINKLLNRMANVHITIGSKTDGAQNALNVAQAIRNCSFDSYIKYAHISPWIAEREFDRIFSESPKH